VQLGGGGSLALCSTVKVRPAIVAFPVRAVVAVLAATSTCTVPAPVPEVFLTISQEDAVEAVHAHSVRVSTVTTNAPPCAVADTRDGEIE
jgi:hypothetical protein